VVSPSGVPRSLVDSEGKVDRRLSPHRWTELTVESVNSNEHLCCEYLVLRIIKILLYIVL